MRGQEAVNGGLGDLTIVEVGQRAQLAQHDRAEQKYRRARPIDLAHLGSRDRTVEHDVERSGVLFGDPNTSRPLPFAPLYPMLNTIPIGNVRWIFTLYACTIPSR